MTRNLKFLLILCAYFLTSVHAQISLKICSASPEDSACQQIARNSEIACNYNFHSVDCLLNIQSNKSHVGRITGDDAILGANLLSEDVVVLAEIRAEHLPSQTVVIVKNSIPDDFINLKGKKFCHPGYANDVTFPHYLLQELEEKILDLNKLPCDTNVTILEQQIKTLSEFFGDSCRPGEWSQHPMDAKLKKRYSSLCRLCDGQSCDTQYKTPFNDSLKCLRDNDADVAVTTLYDAELFFTAIENRQKFKYLCKNGSSTSYQAPCAWNGKLYDLLVAERTSARAIELYLRRNIKSQVNSTTITAINGTANDALTVILKLSSNEQITFLEEYSDYKSLRNYVNDRVSIPTPNSTIECSRTIRWCTYSNGEQEKCKWLSQAAVIWAIQPVVECVRSEGDDELYCLDDIKRERADLVVASSDYAYISLNKGLTNIAFPETDTRNLSIILAVTKSSDTSIKSFQDMKNKRACIPRFGGKEHLAFVDTTRSLKISTDEECDYGKVLNDFVGDSCIPGVRSSLRRDSTEYVDKDKLCQQCLPTEPTSSKVENWINQIKTFFLAAIYCNEDYINKYFGSNGSIECLRDEKGDFAIITKIDLETDADLKVICRNNTLSLYNGLTIDKDCALAVLPNSEVVTLSTSEKKRDIQLALYEFERWFGQNLKKSFHLFDRFNDERNLLFLDSTPGLNIDKDVENIQDYKKLLRNVRQCNTSPSSSTREGSVIVLLSLFMFVIRML